MVIVMKKNLILVIYLIIFSILMVGCSRKINVKINEGVNRSEYTFRTSREIRIFLDDILQQENIEGIYYDDFFATKYNGEKIKKDVDLYVNKIYDNQHIINIKKAYDDGLISLATVEEMWKARYNANLQEEPSESLKETILKNVYNNFKKENPQLREKINLNDITIKYFGNYDGYHAFCYTIDFLMFPAVMEKVNIGGLVFEYSGPSITIYYKINE